MRMRVARALAVLTMLPAPLIGVASGIGVAAAVVLTSPTAEAKTSVESLYGFERTWNAALRLVRVDMGLKVVEKDDGAGYVLFDYKSPESGNKVTAGSIELVRPKDGQGAVQVIVQLAEMPRYHEMAMADSLARKMRAEYGDPPARPIKREAPRDAGPDAAE